VFQEDFEKGAGSWEILDPASWQMKKSDQGSAIEITSRGSEYKPPVRSPGHVALIKNVKVGSFDMTFKVRSTKDTGNHRDCCVFSVIRTTNIFTTCTWGQSLIHTVDRS